MNYIISSYLVTAIDTQHNAYLQPNSEDYIKEWYDSLVASGLNGVILHDYLQPSFIAKFPAVKFYRVPPVRDYNIFDYRWIIYLNFLKTHKFDNCFFTDISDVKVIKAPFTQPEFNSETLYCGDEPGMIGESTWMQNALANPDLMKQKYFYEIITSDLPLFNAGVLGGGYDIVLKFVTNMAGLVEQLKDRPIDGTSDMSLFNYVMHGCFIPVHGTPVNSIFKAEEERNDVWFKHK